MDSVNYTKKVPVVAKVDIAVVGGGMAGVAAALSASMLGRSVLLVERFGVLGGNATSGGVANFCGNTIGQGSVFDLIVSSLEEFGALAPIREDKDGRVFNHEILAVILQELFVRHKIKLMLHTSFIDCIMDGRKIKEILVSGPSGLEAIQAAQYIDCTGDGLVARAAGFSVLKDRYEGWKLPMSLMYFVREVPPEYRKNEVPDGWFPRIDSAAEMPMTTFWPNGPCSKAVKIKVPMFDSTDTNSMTEAEITGRRKMMSVLDYHQRVENRDILLDHCSPIIGIREGLRIEGDYILKTDDLRAGRTFDDCIAVGTFYLDGHKPNDDKATYILSRDMQHVPPYGIPLRCLIAKDGDNLMMAGRCMSAEQMALSSARVMTTASMTGQAAGTTCAMAVEKGIDIRDVPVREIQDVLVAGGAELDLAKVAKVYKFVRK